VAKNYFDLTSNNESKSGKTNTISAEIVLDCLDYQSDRNRAARMVQPKTYWETTMLVGIGKGIELDVDVTRFNTEIHDHLVRTGLRNLLMDAHASATAKADPEGYVKTSRELAEKKLASLYAGIVRVQSVGGVAKPTDPVSAVVMRLARRAIQKEKASDIAAAPKDQRLALINRLAAEYAQSHDVALRPRAEKIVALENVEVEPLPVKKAEPAPMKKGKKAA
jgi:hypothetical protein